MSNGRNSPPDRAARFRRYSSNVRFQHAACRLAVSVMTPSRSNRTASYRARVMILALPDWLIDRSPVASVGDGPLPEVERTRPPDDPMGAGRLLRSTVAIPSSHG